MNAFLFENKIAIIVALFCIPLALKKIGPNGLYGFRFGKALDGPDEWYHMNQVGAFCLIAALAIGVVVKLLVPSVAKQGAAVDTLSLAVGVLLTVVLTRK